MFAPRLFPRVYGMDVNTGLLFSFGVQYVLLLEQDDPAVGALQPKGQKGGAVAHTGARVGHEELFVNVFAMIKTEEALGRLMMMTLVRGLGVVLLASKVDSFASLALVLLRGPAVYPAWSVSPMPMPARRETKMEWIDRAENNS